MAGGKRKNIIVAVVLLAVVLIAWQYLYNLPQLEKQRTAQQGHSADIPGQKADAPAVTALSKVEVDALRERAIASSSRVRINTPRINGSISLKGARIDDVTLVKYRETLDPLSPAIVLLSPAGTNSPLYAEFGWLPASGSSLKIPDQNTVWQQEGTGALSPDSPVMLKYENGDGLIFRRTISIDERYLFSIKDEVTNIGNVPVALYPFALISQHGTPRVSGYYILHEGLIGYLGDQGLQEYTYRKIDDSKVASFAVTDGWLGITERYWAVALLPNTDARLQARFSSNVAGSFRTYQADYLQAPQAIAIGDTGRANARLFAGVKEAGVVGVNIPFVGLSGYNEQLSLNHFDLLIDWGWFYFITKPMYLILHFFYRLSGNFGVGILILTAIIKLIFVPYTNKSYRAMLKIQLLQPQIAAIREHADNREQADAGILELYKRDNVKPPSGCLPTVIFMVLLFFPMFKVLTIAIEAHSPFFGWINDLAAPDPKNLFNLFGLFSFDPATVPLLGDYLYIGAWPAILGLTVWQLQRRISPALLGSTQRKVYAALPFLVAFFSSGKSAGMVISLVFFNFLSIIHQSLLMKKADRAIGDISKYSAELLPYGKSQPIIFLMMLAPALQDVFMFLIFWRRSRKPKKGAIVG